MSQQTRTKRAKTGASSNSSIDSVRETAQGSGSSADVLRMGRIPKKTKVTVQADITTAAQANRVEEIEPNQEEMHVGEDSDEESEDENLSEDLSNRSRVSNLRGSGELMSPMSNANTSEPLIIVRDHNKDHVKILQTSAVKTVRLQDLQPSSIRAHKDFLQSWMLAGQHVGRTAKEVASKEVITSFEGLAYLKNYRKKDVGDFSIPDYIEFLERISQKTETDVNRDPTQQFIDAGKEILCNLHWEDMPHSLLWFAEMMKVAYSMGNGFEEPTAQKLKQTAPRGAALFFEFKIQQAQAKTKQY